MKYVPTTTVSTLRIYGPELIWHSKRSQNSCCLKADCKKKGFKKLPKPTKIGLNQCQSK